MENILKQVLAAFLPVFPDWRVMNEVIKRSAERYETVIIYGIGMYGRRCYFDLRESDTTILIAVTKTDDNRQFHGEKIQQLDSLLQYKEKALVIVSVSEKYRSEMEEYAKKLGFQNVYSPLIKLDDCDYIKEKQDIELKKEIEEWYEVYTGRVLDLNHPRTFNEKIQWLKLCDSTPVKGNLSDKYLVRDYVREKIGQKYLVPICGVWDSFDEIDFDQLPDKFVLKCTHGSGMNEIISSRDEIDYSVLRERFQDWMKMNYAYKCGFELHYKYITPRIIAESYLQTSDGSDLRDYKVHVFNGKAKIVQVDIDRMHVHRRNLYTTEWEYIPYSILYPTAPDVQIEKPDCLQEMIRVSETLAGNFVYVRVDFYIVGGHIYFGEMTFTHGSGVEKFTPEAFDMEMGSWMRLPLKDEDEKL